MRLPAALMVLLLVACSPGQRGTAPASSDAEYSAAQHLLYSEHFEPALAAARAGLAHAEQQGSAAERWKFRLLVADTLLGQRKVPEAEALLGRFEPAPEGGEIQGRLHVLRGRIHYQQRRDQEAAEEFAGAAEIARVTGAENLAAEARFRTGLLLLRQGKYDDAREAFQSVAETAQRLHDGYLAANAVGNIGFLLQAAQRCEEAIPWLEKTIALFTELGAAESVARNHGNLASCYWGLGDYDNAQLHYRITQDGFAKTGNRNSQQIWLGNAANVPFELGDYAAAEQGYLQALELARAVGNSGRAGLWLANLAATSVELGKWDDAARYNAEAATTLRTAGDNQWGLMLAVNAGRVAEGRGDIAEARRLFRTTLSSSGDDPSALLEARAGLARLNVREGRSREAETEFRNTLRMIEASRQKLVKDDYKVSYLASLIRFHRDYVEFLIAGKQPEKALEVADASRARLLEERSGGAAGAKNFTAADYKALSRRMKAVLFEYLLGPQKSYLWVVRPDSIQIHELPARAEIRDLIENYRAVITSGRNPLEVAGEAGRRLYEILLAPGVTGPGRFVVVPDQDLYSFNLEALPKAGAPGQFWLEDATVLVVPSLNYLAGKHRAAGVKQGSGLLAMGNVAGGTPQYPVLEFAGQEIAAVAKSVGGPGTLLLQGDSATPAAYTIAQPKRFGYIHFAAHAAANRQTPLDSAVILAGVPEKRRLLARDVMAIPLTAELVTISACRSAGGKTWAGEGMVGFTWAFLRAGAHNVIAGLWDVSDRSTAQLMGGLYSQIAAGNSPPEALRAAKLELIHTAGGAYAKPFYWAPFQIYVGWVP